MAHREAAPWKADCLTAIWYIYKQAFDVDIPITWIGNMPREMSLSKDWALLEVSLDNLKPGDLLFVKNVGKKRLISHIAMVIHEKLIFHCSHDLGAVIQSTNKFFSLYEQQLTSSEIVRYIDFRDKELRAQYGNSHLIPNSGYAKKP